VIFVDNDFFEPFVETIGKELPQKEKAIRRQVYAED
jgi:hypothetical protein